MRPLITALASLLVFSCGFEENQPNIILVLVDDQGWTDSSVRMMKNKPTQEVIFMRHLTWKGWLRKE